LDQGPSFLQVWFYPHAASMRSLLGQTNPISFTFSSSVSAVASYDVLLREANIQRIEEKRGILQTPPRQIVAGCRGPLGMSIARDVSAVPALQTMPPSAVYKQPPPLYYNRTRLTSDAAVVPTRLPKISLDATTGAPAQRYRLYRHRAVRITALLFGQLPSPTEPYLRSARVSHGHRPAHEAGRETSELLFTSKNVFFVLVRNWTTLTSTLVASLATPLCN
jgi:hypothetical protein